MPKCHCHVCINLIYLQQSVWTLCIVGSHEAKNTMKPVVLGFCTLTAW